MNLTSLQKKEPLKSPIKLSKNPGEQIYQWAVDLFPINRSLSGEGNRETIRYLQSILPGLEMKEVRSGARVLDWTVPDEWNIRDAWIKDSNANKIVDFKESNLHVVGYSIPVHKKMGLDELQNHLYSLPEQPDAIPYVTSYYKQRWGFCLAENQRKSLKEDDYEVFIDSTLEPGVVNYAELVLPGASDKEVFLSTNICHPSMANNELSGPTVLAAIAAWLQNRQDRRYTYRFLFIPETIGSIIYLAEMMDHLKEKVIAGFSVYAVGDNRNYSFISTPDEDTYADRLIEHVYKHHSGGDYIKFPFTERGSDERQYCAPGVDLPVVGVCRSKSGLYDEYHTSLDDLTVISPEGLQGGFDIVKKAVELLEHNRTYRVSVFGEPQMGRRGLYPDVSTLETLKQTRAMMNLIAYSNGKRSLLDIAEKTNTYVGLFYPFIEDLKKHHILVEVEDQ